MTKPLYKIADEILSVEDMDPEGDENFAEALKNSLDELNMDLYEKVDNIVKYKHHIEQNCVSIKNEIDRLRSRLNDFNMKQTALDLYILEIMFKLNKKKLETELFTLTSVTGRMKVIIDNENEIPNKYIAIKMSESPDKKALASAMKEEEVPGCHMEKSPNSLRIK